MLSNDSVQVLISAIKQQISWASEELAIAESARLVDDFAEEFPLEEEIAQINRRIGGLAYLLDLIDKLSENDLPD